MSVRADLIAAHDAVRYDETVRSLNPKQCAGFLLRHHDSALHAICFIAEERRKDPTVHGTSFHPETALWLLKAAAEGQTR